MKRWLVVPAIVLLAAGCEAEQEVFEQGADMEAPPAVEEAPIAPMPPQLEPGGVVPVDTLQEIRIDTTGSPAVFQTRQYSPAPRSISRLMISSRRSVAKSG